MLKFWGCFCSFMSLTIWKKTGDGWFLFAGTVMLVCVFGMAFCDMIMEYCRIRIRQIEEEKK